MRRVAKRNDTLPLIALSINSTAPFIKMTLLKRQSTLFTRRALLNALDLHLNFRVCSWLQDTVIVTVPSETRL